MMQGSGVRTLEVRTRIKVDVKFLTWDLRDETKTELEVEALILHGFCLFTILIIRAVNLTTN